MKKLIVIIGLFLSVILTAQDESVDNLPAKSSLSGSATEYFYLLDGATDKHFTGLALTDLIGDSLQIALLALIDSAADLRADMNTLFSGEGYFLKRTGISGGNTSRTLVPKDGANYLGLYIGDDPGSSYTNYRLYVYGLSYFNNRVLINQSSTKRALTQGIHFGSITEELYITMSGDTMYFKDVTTEVDPVTLSELLTLPSTLLANTTINTSTYDLNLIDDSGYGYIRDQGEDITKLASGTEIQLEAPDITITGDIDLIGDVYFDEPVENFRADTIYIGDTKLYNNVYGTTAIVTPFDVNPYLNITFDWVDYDPYITRPLFITPAIQLIPIITDNLPPDPNPGALYFNEDSDLYVYAKNNGEYVYIDTTGSLNDGGVGGTLDSAEVADADYRVVLVYDNTLTYYDTVPLVADTTKADYDTLDVDEVLNINGDVNFGDNATFNNHSAGIIYDTLISISSANILAGDSIMLIPAPGSGKVIFPIRIGIYFNYVTAAYTNVVDSYIKTYKNAGTAFNRYKVGAQIFTSTVDQFYPSATGSDYLEELYGTSILAMDANAPYWLDLDDMDTGEGDAKIYFVYKIIDFN